MDNKNSGTMSVREAGSRGGRVTSQNREHMVAIGRRGGRTRSEQLGAKGYKEMGTKGGRAVSRDRAHMAEIGRKGGEAKRRKANGG